MDSTVHDKKGPSPATLSRLSVFAMGLAAGAVAFLIANAVTPETEDHDLILSHNIGYVFPAIAGLWAGWIQRSLVRMLIGMCCGSLTGLFYATLCGDDFNLVGIILGFPAICGGMLAAAIGSSAHPWLDGLLGRFWRGTVAGLVCGIVYYILLNVIVGLFSISTPSRFTHERYLDSMWTAGSIALAVGGGFFFLLLRWALRLPGRKAEGNKQSQKVGKGGHATS